MNDTFIYAVIGLVSIFAIAFGYTLSSLRNRMRIDQLREKYIELNIKLDEQKTQTNQKFSSVEKMRHGIEEKLSTITQEEHIAELPADKDKFTELMLHPLQDALVSADQQVKSMSREGEKARNLLQHQMDILRSPLQLGRGSYNEIANSLGDEESRKTWGLKTIKELLEITYMTDHYRAYSDEDKLDDKHEDIPAFTIQMADGDEIVIDAHTPLEPYVSVCKAPDDSVRGWHQETHARKLRERIMLISSRAYSARFEKPPQMRVLLVLNDHYLSMALNVESDILKTAEAQGVVLATPTDLLTLLQAVSFGWKHKHFATDAHKMRQTGIHLYKNFGTFIKLIAELGSELTGVMDSYQRAVNYMENEASQSLDNNKASNDSQPKPQQKTSQPVDIKKKPA